MTERHLFSAFGIELEYMIVDAATLGVRPVADELLRAVAGEITGEVELGSLAWSNELVLHVVEMKTNGPVPRLAGLAELFTRHAREADELLAPLGARLMPTAMHPWMDPARETRLWPHDNGEIYEAFNRVFDCRGHGWSNLQSMHINLPFAGDEEFGRLHAAVRLVLPILPALAASSPVVERRPTGTLDNRLAVYRTNCARIPSVSGRVIPEPVFTRGDYEAGILERIYRDIAPHDPEGILRHEWLNARGAIARFERDTIEIRVIDVQECPRADLAIAAAVIEVLRSLVGERWAGLDAQQAWATEPLEEIFLAAVREAESAVISNADYLKMFGFPGAGPATAGELWRHVVDAVLPAGAAESRPWRDVLDVILAQGTLARRIARQLGPRPSDNEMEATYRQLCECLRTGEMFVD